MFPKYLYRYRPASLKSIEALRTNRLYFSTANYYDDPFDTFINIDLQDMKRVFDELSQNYEEEKIFEAEPVPNWWLSVKEATSPGSL